METFGVSAPIQQIQAKFGFEPGHVIEAEGPAGPLAPGMSHVPALSARHQKEGIMP
jgi:hypothetical protein